ncbi:MAG TPA: 2Fe-2S iron-sulfur cluster-binding protein [Pirellulales bacterium]|nr:2Fe-2S iron-sulfur cluster-binding protein [Pirellulales bacterium]
MGIVLVDGKEVEVGDHERLNGIQAAARAGIDIPRYCWHPGLTVVASCRMCLVESGTRDAATGKISMVPKLVPACQTPAKDGTVFVTNSENVRKSRAMVEEDLLIDHPIDCPICDKAGECLLQDYHFEHGQTARRADVKPFTSRRREMGDTVTLFVDRCVMCTRCVRFTREITGTSELLVINRGSHEEIDVFPGYPLENKMSGNVVDLCPVGALGDKDFLYRQRVWFMKKHPGVCTLCSTGCSIYVEENQDSVQRLKPRENPAVNQWWMCDEGRYGWHYVHSHERVIEPRRWKTDPRGDAHAAIDWRTLVDELPIALGQAGKLAVVLSPHLTVEEAYLLAKLVRSIDLEAVIALGPVPVVGEDEKFKNGFTIHAEKCPNRRGVEAVIQHFTGTVLGWSDFLNRVDTGEFGGVWVTAGYPHPWIDEEDAKRFAGIKQLVVQDLFDSPLWDRAHWQIPAAAYPEREGSYVNFQERLQFAQRAIRPPSGVWADSYLYWRLLAMPGLFNARKALSEVAAAIPYFSLAGAVIPEQGVDLKLNKIAPDGVDPAFMPNEGAPKDKTQTIA